MALNALMLGQHHHIFLNGNTVLIKPWFPIPPSLQSLASTVLFFGPWIWLLYVNVQMQSHKYNHMVFFLLWFICFTSIISSRSVHVVMGIRISILLKAGNVPLYFDSTWIVIGGKDIPLALAGQENHLSFAPTFTIVTHHPSNCWFKWTAIKRTQRMTPCRIECNKQGNSRKFYVCFQHDSKRICLWGFIRTVNGQKTTWGDMGPTYLLINCHSCRS